jgi:chloride channel 3/4/5
VDVDTTWHVFELLGFVWIGVLGGVLGSLFIQWNTRWVQQKPFQNPLVEIMLLSLITSLLSFWIPLLQVPTAELIRNLFSSCSKMESDVSLLLCDSPVLVPHLLAVLVVKFVLTVCTFGSGVPAGVFVPSMAMGAVTGRLVGLAMSYYQLCTDCEHGTYALIGAAAGLAGVTRMTVSLTVIMFELTGAVSFILPIMITVVIAKFVGEAIEPHSIYDTIIQQNEYPWFSQDVHVKTVRVRDIMTPAQECVCITENVDIAFLSTWN